MPIMVAYPCNSPVREIRFKSPGGSHGLGTGVQKAAQVAYNKGPFDDDPTISSS